MAAGARDLPQVAGLRCNQRIQNSATTRAKQQQLVSLSDERKSIGGRIGVANDAGDERHRPASSRVVQRVERSQLEIAARTHFREERREVRREDGVDYSREVYEARRSVGSEERTRIERERRVLGDGVAPAEEARPTRIHAAPRLGSELAQPDSSPA